MANDRFRATTRLLTRREVRELMLNKYEDSLYPARQQRSKKRKTKRATSDVTHAGNSDAGHLKQRRQTRRARNRAAATPQQ